MTIGERIKEIRKQNKLTQVQLGKLTGISADIIGKYEKGVRTPKEDRLEVIANALGTSVFTLQGTSVSEDEEFVQLLMKLDEAALIDIERNSKEITIKFQNKIHHSNNLATYLNTWLNARDGLNDSSEITDMIDYENWKNNFPLNIQKEQEQKLTFFNKYFEEHKAKQQKTHKKISRRSELVLTLKNMLETDFAFDCIRNDDITNDKIPNVVHIPTIAFPICIVDELLQPMDASISPLAGSNRKANKLFTDFLLELDDIKTLGITVETFIAIKGNTEYLCYTIHMPELSELPVDIALVKNQLPHTEDIPYYATGIIDDDSKESFEKSFAERLDDSDFFFRDKISSN